MGIGRLFRWIGRTLLGLVIIISLLFGAIQTGPGKEVLASIAGSLASSGGLRVSIEGIGGFVPSDMTVRRISLADDKGAFAEVDNLRLVWDPLALARGTVSVEAVEAARVALLRGPELPPTPEAPASSGSTTLLPIRIARLAVPDIDIAEPVAGYPARLSLDASADLVDLAQGLSLTFALQRQDAPGAARGTLRYQPEGGVLDLDIEASEPAGGLVARAAGMPDLPDVEATLKGKGPLDAWDGHLSLSAGDVARIAGAAGIRSVAEGRRVTLAIDADIARLLPPNLAPLFEQRTEIAATAVVEESLRTTISAATLRAAGFGAQVTGTIDPSAQSANLEYVANLGDAGRFAALVPDVTWRTVRVDGTLRGAFAAPSVVASVKAEDLAASGYGAGVVNLTARTVPDANGALALSVEGDADALRAADPKVAAALGRSARFTLTGSRPVAADPVISGITVALTPLDLRFAGTATAKDIDGQLHLQRLDLAALSSLAGRPLAGTARLDATIDANADLSRVDLVVKGGAQAIHTGIAAVDGLFGGDTALSGALARGQDGAIAVNGLKLAAKGLDLTVDGRIDRSTADLKALVALADLAVIDPRVSGAMTANAGFTGTLDRLGLKATISVPSGRAMGQPIEKLALNVDASDLTGRPGGSFTLDGRIAGKPADGAGRFATLDDGSRRLDGLDVGIGSVTAKGGVNLAANGLVTGKLAVAAGNLADLSAIALTELAGRLDADVTFDAAGGRQRVAVKASANKLRAAGQSIDSARIDATVVDPAGIPVIDGRVDASGVSAGGLAVAKASLVARSAREATQLDLDAVVEGATIDATGRLSLPGDTLAFRLDTLKIAKGANTVATTAPSNFTLKDGAVTIDRLNLAARGGSVTVAGRAGQTLDLTVDIRALPLALAELAAPGLGLSGTLAGNARIAGTAKAPTGSYELTLQRVSTPDLAASGAGPLDISARGQLNGGRVGVNASVSGPSLSGVTISGSAPIGAGELDIAARGTVALAIVNPILSTSGMRLTGDAAVDATIKGTPAAPRAGGTVRISGGRFDDSVNGVTLDQIAGVITGTERTVTVTTLTARTPNGGSVQARGTVGLDPGAGFPGKVDVTLQNAGLVSSELMRLVAEGTVAVEGAFARAPRIAGRVLIKSLDINIPDNLGAAATSLNVRHVNEPKGRVPTASSARAVAAKPAPSSGGGLPLDLVVSAPNNVFVRGMGMEAELGGELKVGGTSQSPITNGGFEMRRGRFDILGRRFDFTRGKITFVGTTDPDLDFVAETTSNDVTARVLVTGPASQPEITFASTPTLPQDEVLARLMFGRSAGSLTAGQAVQVAQTIAQFSGGGAGALDRVRRSLGVDSLDVGTNAAGTGGQVGLGKRLNDKIYLGVQQGTTPNSSRVTIDLDITKNIRLQGATGADGSTSVGIGAQWDY
ncbi:translocation/assembly module TamB domain-containing protein [Ancylobacter terrae]|uniref:translocation/assembly module TamB domain-containing protein n=1 Tax=Ancylobacter sp. sgz301288 TaxID=3342077 RepID=UPI00385BCA79